jgi:hypothetical protein
MIFVVGGGDIIGAAHDRADLRKFLREQGKCA